MEIRIMRQIKDLKNKTVLLRVDFNVPIKNGKIIDDYKIKKTIPTIEHLAKKGAKIILISHLGRPEGFDKKLSLRPVAVNLEKILKKKIKILDLKNWEKTTKEIKAMKAGEAVMLENIRFLPGEEKNEKNLAKALATLADIFVLDGFAVSHRAAASVSGIARYLPAYAGLLLEDEIKGLAKFTESPKKPFTAVLGGVKMETKIPIIKNLLKKADYILLGGGIVNTYLWANGIKIGSSIIEKNLKKKAAAFGKNKKIIMPVDLIVGKKDGKNARVVDLSYENGKMKQIKITNSEGIYDIGPKTIELYSRYIKKSFILVWNGAMGYFERHPYEYGTYSIARLVAEKSKGKTFGAAGGGETIEVLKKLRLTDDIDLVSTGGGAMLEFLAGKNLPGVDAVRIGKKFRNFLSMFFSF
ncbi:MAG: phosphoglycerate kinase [Patescibacteria group bacterium]|nr:phosphoglycerate kinase [Patescibacteria group bacterium]